MLSNSDENNEGNCTDRNKADNRVCESIPEIWDEEESVSENV
jgi:hypothetical protein